MRIIKSNNPSAVLNKVLYDDGGFSQEERRERTGRALERLNDSLGERGGRLLERLGRVSDFYAGDDIFDEVDFITSEVTVNRESEKSLVRPLRIKNTLPNRRTIDSVLCFPEVKKLYQENRINGFGLSKDEFDEESSIALYSKIVTGYCDGETDAFIYEDGSDEDLTEAEKRQAFENMEAVIANIAIGKDLT